MISSCLTFLALVFVVRGQFGLLQIPLAIGVAILAQVGRGLYLKGKRAGVIPGCKLLKIDKRPPVLYLRSFDFDATAGGETGIPDSATMPFIPVSLRFQTYEEVLARILTRVGPCIAIGKPGLQKPIVGFSRLQVGDNWRDEVIDFLKRSALVVYCAGVSPSLMWELEQLSNLTSRERLLILVGADTPEKWWEQASPFLGAMPKFTVRSESNKVFLGLIYFDKNQKPCDELIIEDGQPLRTLMENALDPLLRNLNVVPRSKFLRWLSRPRNIVLLGLISLAMLILLLLSWIECLDLLCFRA